MVSLALVFWVAFGVGSSRCAEAGGAKKAGEGNPGSARNNGSPIAINGPLFSDPNRGCGRRDFGFLAAPVILTLDYGPERESSGMWID